MQIEGSGCPRVLASKRCPQDKSEHPTRTKIASKRCPRDASTDILTSKDAKYLRRAYPSFSKLSDNGNARTHGYLLRKGFPTYFAKEASTPPQLHKSTCCRNYVSGSKRKCSQRKIASIPFVPMKLKVRGQVPRNKSRAPPTSL